MKNVNNIYHNYIAKTIVFSNTIVTLLTNSTNKIMILVLTPQTYTKTSMSNQTRVLLITVNTTYISQN